MTGTGTIPKDNPFRFSTKRTDDNTDLVLYEYRPYIPSLGRWPSRDPLGEPGFESLRGGEKSPVGDGPNIYAFVRNRGDGWIDPWGLLGCSGPDVTRPLSATLAEVGETYRRWRFAEKLSACRALYDIRTDENGIRTASVSWDMQELFRLGANRNLPSGQCDRTVSVFGKCYYAGSVNYALWGKMNSLCHGTFGRQTGTPGLWSLTMALGTVSVWKVIEYGDVGDTHTQALAFTMFGYNGGLPSGGLTSCTVTGRAVPHERFHWTWEPMHIDRENPDPLENYL
jgi:RHS repeat-associated protein